MRTELTKDALEFLIIKKKFFLSAHWVWRMENKHINLSLSVIFFLFPKNTITTCNIKNSKNLYGNINLFIQ